MELIILTMRERDPCIGTWPQYCRDTFVFHRHKKNKNPYLHSPSLGYWIRSAICTPEAQRKLEYFYKVTFGMDLPYKGVHVGKFQERDPEGICVPHTAFYKMLSQSEICLRGN